MRAKPQPKLKKCCATCDDFVPKTDGDIGQCRFLPPQLICLPQDTDVGGGKIETRMVPRSVFPPIFDDQIKCGQWSPKK
jgi:hypothetical protein